MSEKLIIRNFGPITNVELDLRNVNVLIGDQGTGKSTVAKLLWVLKNTAYHHCGEISITIASKEIKNEDEIQDYRNKQFRDEFNLTIEKIELKNYLNEKTYIFLETNFCKIEITSSEINFRNKGKSKEKNTDQNYFIPASREAYILVKDKYPALSIVDAKLPILIDYFGLRFNKSREKLKNFNFKNILGVDYKYINGYDKIILNDGNEISFEESSSAVNSVVPLLVVFLGVIKEMSQDAPNDIFYNLNCPFFTIEEPELNCYPSTQKTLIEFFIEKIQFKNKYKNTNEYYCNLLLTTHSPYILTSLNNLMYAYNVGKDNFEETNKIIPSKNWLNPNDVSVYKLVRGESVSIMDEELKQIKVEEIDEISEILSKQWHEMAELNLVKH